MLGGVIILWQSSIAMGVVGAVLVLIGTPLAWPREEFGGSWYGVLIGGGLLCVLSPLVAIGAATLGGWMGAIGCLLIVCGGIAGLPALRLSGNKSTTL